MNCYFNLHSVKTFVVLLFSAILFACATPHHAMKKVHPFTPIPPKLEDVDPSLPADITTFPKGTAAITPELIKVPFDAGRSGQSGGASVAGVSVWQLPDAPSGSSPDQSWLAVGSDAQGEIYISGHDHHSNSMLYRLYQHDKTLRWVGDARTASLNADNWLPGESAEKFHTRPIAHQGQIYVATLDKSAMDRGFMNTRGFHWYGYDKQQEQLLDLSASEPNGVGGKHLQIVSIQVDAQRDLIYGMSIPENKLVVYDIKQGQTTILGRPKQWQGYFYSNRFMWVDSRGCVYISGGSERAQWHRGEAKNIFNHIWYYDPKTGFGELAQFPLQGANAIEVGQWDRKHERLYVSDDMGNIYRFRDADASWTFLGRPDFSDLAKTWVFQLSADEKKIYIGLSDRGSSRNAIYEYDIETGTSFELVNMRQLDKQVAKEDFIAGYDSWDKNGHFYIAAFSMYDGDNVLMLAINPVEIKVSQAFLPELVEVTAQQVDDKLLVRRTGEGKQSLTVLYQLNGFDSNNHMMVSEYGELILAAGQTDLSIQLDNLPAASTQQLSIDGLINMSFEVVADGNTYILGRNKRITLN